MHDPPFAVLTPKDAGHAQRVRHSFAASYLAVVSLDLDDVCQLSSCVFGNAFESEHFALAQLGCSALQCFGDLLPALCRRSEWIGKRDVVTPGIQPLLRLRV